MVSAVASILLTIFGVFLCLLLWVLMMAASPNSSPALGSALRNLTIALWAVALISMVGVPVSLLLGQQPAAWTLAVLSVLASILVFLAFWELGKEPLPPEWAPSTGKLIVRCLILLAFGGGGLAMFYVGAREHRNQRLLLGNSQTIEAEIIRSEVVKSESTDLDREPLKNRTTYSYTPDLRFRYSFNNQTYESEQLRPTVIVRAYASQESAQQEIAPFPLGAKVKAYINPDMPDKAYLLQESSAGPMVFLIVGGLLPILAQIAGRLI